MQSALSFGSIGPGVSLAVRRSGVSAFSSKGVDFIDHGIVAIAVSAVSIDRGGTSVVHSSSGGELLATYKGFLVRGTAC